MSSPPSPFPQPVVSAEGVPKTELAAAHTRSVNPWADIATVDADLASLTPAVFDGISVAVLGLDNHRARLQAGRLLMAATVPYVDVASLASRWHARVTVCDPGRTLAVNGEGLNSCLLCSWSPRSLARAGEDVGFPCAGVAVEQPYASSLTMGQRAATIGAREALAIANAIDLSPSVGCELRDDMSCMRVERFVVPADEEGCASYHALACRKRRKLDVEPSEVRLGALGRECGIGADEDVVLASREIVEVAMCVSCFAPGYPYRRFGGPRASCASCGGEMAPVRRTRRLRWGAAVERVGGALASEWFEPGDHFAVVGSGGTRSFSFPSVPIAWQTGAPWNAREDVKRFQRLPDVYRLEQIRRTRIAIVGVGHVGAAVLQQLAPLPWAGILLLDRDRYEGLNAAAYPLAATATREKRS